MLTVKYFGKLFFIGSEYELVYCICIFVYFRNAYSELPQMISINPQSHCIHQFTLSPVSDWLMECDPLCDWLVTSHRSLFAA